MFRRKKKLPSNLADTIKTLAMNASQIPYGGTCLCTPWEELTVGELLEWMKEEEMTKGVSYDRKED
jgi:hypothetical protein